MRRLAPLVAGILLALFVMEAQAGTTTRRKKKNEYFNIVSVGPAVTHGVPQYFQRTATALTSTDTEFDVWFLEFKHNGSGLVQCAVVFNDSAPAGGDSAETIFIPGGSVVRVEGHRCASIQVTSGTASGSLYITGER